MGNNEINGLYGPKTAVTFFGKHPRLIPAFHRLKQTRTVQLTRRLLGINPEAVQTKRKPPTAEFFRKHATALDDPERDYVYANFRHNLERICGYGLEAGAAVIVSTVGVNLRDCPPLGARHRSDLTEPQREEWERLCRKGVMAEVGGDTAAALSWYEQALALDGHHAELHFRLARCRLRAGEREAARRHFTLARDWDALQFRADARLNDLVREVAAEWKTDDRGQKTGDAIPNRPSALPQVRLVEADAALAASEKCPDGIPGREIGICTTTWGLFCTNLIAPRKRATSSISSCGRSLTSPLSTSCWAMLWTRPAGRIRPSRSSGWPCGAIRTARKHGKP
jgi:hypothetical protein